MPPARKNDLSHWLLSSELGAYLLAAEQNYFDQAVADIFGFHAVQLGLPEVDLLRANRISWQCHAAASGPAQVCCQAEYLPFDTRSLDLVLLPHVLDFTTEPHQVLREVERVLMPEGRVVLTGFNPLSLWGGRRLFSNQLQPPWSGRFLSMTRVKDWLALLGLEAEPCQLMVYAPPLVSEHWRQRFAWSESIGQRCWPGVGAVYGIAAVKRVRGMRLVGPKWQTQKVPAGLVAAGNDYQNKQQNKV